VVEVAETDIVEIPCDGSGPKVKFPRGVVVHCGGRESATRYLYERGGAGHAIVGGTATAGVRGTATAGYGGTATAGYGGTATAGDSGTATAGYGGTATAGVRGTATAGVSGTATAGDSGTATAGYGGVCAIRWWNGHRYRWAIREVGPDGLKPDTRYRLTEDGEFEEVPQ
jgi:hypothetical protein